MFIFSGGRLNDAQQNDTSEKLHSIVYSYIIRTFSQTRSDLICFFDLHWYVFGLFGTQVCVSSICYFRILAERSTYILFDVSYF